MSPLESVESPPMPRRARIPTRDTRSILAILVAHEADLPALLAAHAGAVSTATLADYYRHMETMRAWCETHHVMPWALRVTLTLIRDGTYRT